MAIYKTVIRGAQFGQTVDVVHGWLGPGTDNATDALAIAHKVWTYWTTDIMGLTHDSYVIQGVDAFGILDPTVAASYGGSFAGVLTGDPLPASLCANVHLATGLRGRSYNGRYGIPALQTTAVDTTDGNRLDATAFSLLETAQGAFITDVHSSLPAVSMAVVSLIHNKAPRVPPIATPVTSSLLKPLFGTRNSRKG